jgi:hypothetical protein
MNEGLEVDPNPSSFLPLIFVIHNSTNLSSTICFTIRLSKLPPTSDMRSEKKKCKLSTINYQLSISINAYLLFAICAIVNSFYGTVYSSYAQIAIANSK